MALLILVCLLPRLALATPEGTILCIAIDHMSSDCHGADEHCGSDEGEVHVTIPADHATDSCVDVTGIPLGKTDRTAVDAASAHPLHVLVDAIRLSPPAENANTLRIAGHGWPPSFCARAFSCSIVIRS